MPTTQELKDELQNCIDRCRAIRVQRVYDEWPEGHPEAKAKPKFVKEFELVFGPNNTEAPFR